MSDKIDVNAIIEPTKGDFGATPQGELRNFIRQLEAQLPPEAAPDAMVIFGAPRYALHRIRAAMLCACEALDALEIVKEAN